MKLSSLALAAACIAMLSGPHDAIAQDQSHTANYVMDGCRSFIARDGSENFKQGLCGGSVFAVVSVGPGVCLPQGVKDIRQVIRVVMAYIDARPARMHENFNTLALERSEALGRAGSTAMGKIT